MKAMTLNFKKVGFSINEFKDEIKINWRMLVLFALFFTGMLLGVSVYAHSGNAFDKSAEKIIASIPNVGFFSTFTVLFAAAIIPVLIAFLAGFSALGLPVVICVPVLYGTVLSVICSYLYNAYKIDGVIFSIILILPAVIIIELMQLIGCNESLILTGSVAQAAFLNKPADRGDVRAFFLRYAIIIIAIGLITALQALCVAGFGSKLLF